MEVRVDHATTIRGGQWEWAWGYSLAAGCDLDHDGRLEWAVAAPRNDDTSSLDAVVRVFEGLEEVTERHPWLNHAYSHGWFLDAGPDVDGDGYPDLLYTTDSTSKGARAVIVHGVDDDGDTQLARWAGATTSTGTKMATFLRRANGQPPFLLAQWDDGNVALVDTAFLEIGRFQRISLEDLVAVPESDGRHGDSGRADTDGDGNDEWVYGLRCRNECGPEEGVFVCPADPSVAPPDGCVAMTGEDVTAVGESHASGDLDGDGLDEIVSVKDIANGDDGFVVVYRGDGSVLAKIQGTHGAMFGRSPTVVHDGDGEPWLLIRQSNLSGNDPGSVWAFRGENVVGDLIEEDADRLYVSYAVGDAQLGTSMTTYRATPDDPVMLLIGSPGSNSVYMVPFDPPMSPMGR